jgi:hypothetical protein
MRLRTSCNLQDAPGDGRPPTAKEDIMKVWVACLLVVGMLVAAPEAGAEVTQTQTVDTVGVVGVGRLPMPVSATPAEADSVYHQSLVQAVADGLLKAQLLAAATGAKVGPIEAIGEDGKHIECKDSVGEVATYKGAEPDFGSAVSPIVAVEPTVPPKPATPAKPAHHKARKSRTEIARKTRKIIAKKAENAATSCELTTEVALIYNLEVPRSL